MHAHVPTPPADRRRLLSRRELLKRTGLLGAIVAFPGVTRAARSALARPAAGALTAPQLGTLQAIAARLVPTDELGPGATEAGAATFIDRQLADFLAPSLAEYTAGLAATDAYAQAKKGAAFAALRPADQDAVITDLQNGVATGGFSAGSASFFNLVRTHTIQGMLSDPYYGGNRNFVGWAWLGYPGIRMPVKPGDTRLGQKLQLMRMSAYEMARWKSGPPKLKG
jgi:gluconate 2-dehydrogenase gamma chain